MLRRWLAVLGAALLFLFVLFALAALFNLANHSEFSTLLARNMKRPVVVRFIATLVTREVLPIYLLTGWVLWVLGLGWALLPTSLGWGWRAHWGALDGFLATFGLLGLLHVVLWWKVPTALWVLPGISRLPYWLAFPLLTGLMVGLLLWVVVRSRAARWRMGLTLAGWLLIAWGGAVLPLKVAQWRVEAAPAAGGNVKVLLLGIDGLRADTPELAQLKGLHFPNAYTAIPATRLLFSILWGGDPEHYSLGHVFPDIDELTGKHPFLLLDEMKARGLKTRFYIDDGGTIGLATRTGSFDAVEMPARGWENFVNSNLSGHVPLYSAWLDVLRIFPSTHPWASMDAGLKATLARGRGADWVIYHSCLPHQPIFLNREELGQIPKWWNMAPKDFIPYFSIRNVNPEDLARWDQRKDPLKLYQIRVGSILKAWAPVWNGLDKDPDYGNAQRVFMSDHGERFYHMTETIRIAGVHGFDVDPWQTRIPFVLAAPRIQPGQGPAKAVSFLALRDAIAQCLLEGQPITPESLTSRPFAPIRYHTLSTEEIRPTGKKYFELKTEKVVTSMAMGPAGVWAMKVDRPASQRSGEVTVARAEGSRLVVFKPLLEGGAHRLEYDDYRLVSEREIGGQEFTEEKKDIETEFFKRYPSPKAP